MKVQNFLTFLCFTVLFSVCAHAESSKKTITTNKFEFSIPSTWKRIVNSNSRSECTTFRNPRIKHQSFALMVCTTTNKTADVLDEHGYIKVGDKFVRGGYGVMLSIAQVKINSNYVSISSRVSCGISDEAGFHAAGGICYTLIALAGDYAVTFETDGTEQNDKEIVNIFNSINLKTRNNVNKTLNNIKNIPPTTDLDEPLLVESWGADVSPSFNCAEASSSIEKTICADARLSLLDATLDSNYKRLKSANPGDRSGQLLADQRAWIKQRNACKTPECLTKVYSQRIDELCAKYPATSGESPACTLVKDIEFAP